MNDQPTSALADLLSNTARLAGLTAIRGGMEDRPDVMIIDPQRGLLAVDTASSSDVVNDMRELNRRIARLIEDVPEVDEVHVHRFILTTDTTTPSDRYRLPAAAARSMAWAETLSGAAIPLDLSEALQARLEPAVAFTIKSRGPLTDEGLVERQRARLILDAAQSRAAIRKIEDVLVVRGPAGSGKSLVLAARARWLAENHPNWRIQVLCYNKALSPYLGSLIAAYPNITVETFGLFAHRLGHRLDFESQIQAARDLASAKRRGIGLEIDALLIDEWQDFFPAWTTFALESLFPHRGGALIVGDPQQALYREAGDGDGLDGHLVEETQLTRPYRCTRQILEVVEALDPDFMIEGSDLALDGEPVELIWAQTPAEQARAVAADLQLLGQAGRPWSDIGVLITNRYMLGAICRALDARSIPYLVVTSATARSMDLTSDRVKILTVHSAKGLEFGVICLLGLESLKDHREAGLEMDDRAARTRRARLGLVGATRARDQLLITYSRACVYIDRLRNSDAPFRSWTWPDDYEV